MTRKTLDMTCPDEPEPTVAQMFATALDELTRRASRSLGIVAAFVQRHTSHTTSELAVMPPADLLDIADTVLKQDREDMAALHTCAEKAEETTWGAMELHALEAIEREKRMWVTAMEAIDAQAVAFSNNPNVHAALAQVRAAVTISLGESMRMTMIGAIKIAARTGAALRPAGKASLYYLLSPQPGLHVAPGEPVTLEQSHLCLPSRHGAVPASPDVADMLGPWEVIPVEQAQRERAAVVEQGEVLQ